VICIICKRKLDPNKDTFLYLRVGTRGIEESVGLCKRRKCRREYEGDGNVEEEED
jgi:hypothetical protein